MNGLGNFLFLFARSHANVPLISSTLGHSIIYFSAELEKRYTNNLDNSIELRYILWRLNIQLLEKNVLRLNCYSLIYCKINYKKNHKGTSTKCANSITFPWGSRILRRVMENYVKFLSLRLLIIIILRRVDIPWLLTIVISLLSHRKRVSENFISFSNLVISSILVQFFLLYMLKQFKILCFEFYVIDIEIML